MFLSGDGATLGPIPQVLLDAAVDWATDEAISAFIHLNA